MKQEKQLKKLSAEFSTLNEQDKTYILGVTKALSFASKDNRNSSEISQINKKQKGEFNMCKTAFAGS